MFNRSVFFAGGTNVHVNAVSGGIVKNHPDSYFLTFHLSSNLAEQLLSSIPHVKGSRYPYTERYVEVLQMVICGDMEVIAEIIDIPPKPKGNENGN